MPIYEYYCYKCQKEFELMRPINEVGEAAPCPSCGSWGKKLVSASASKVDFYIRPATKPPFRQHASERSRKAEETKERQS